MADKADQRVTSTKCNKDSHRDNDLTANEENEEALEKEHFQKVVQAFLSYKRCFMLNIDKRRIDYAKIPKHHQKIIPDYLKGLEDCTKCVEANYELIESIIMQTGQMFQNADYTPEEEGTLGGKTIPFTDQHKVVTTLTQIVRDWAAEGKLERETSYGPIIQKLQSLYREQERKQTYVLVPGAGAGRLMFDIAKLGFACQGNEFSLFMLFASNYILNRVSGKNSVTFYPWVHQFCNVIRSSDQLVPVHFPDTDPRELPPDANFSMAAGDFLEIYTINNTWDCIVTCFFIDTAHNIIAYIEKICHILKPGGYWINNGPLLYHFADVAGEVSIELPYEEVKRIITEEYKLELIEEKLGLKSHYIQNHRSMLKMSYECAFFVVRKPCC